MSEKDTKRRIRPLKWYRRFFYLAKKGGIDSESEWRLQNEQMRHNEIYEMVNFSSGGTFVDAYESGGDTPEEKAKGLQQFFLNEIKPKYLYADEELVDFSIYQQWHNENFQAALKFIRKHKESADDDPQDGVQEGNQVNGSIASLDTVVLPFKEHKIKWRLNMRGAVGETPLHLMFLLNTPKHNAMAKALLKVCPEIAMDVYEGSEYYGETMLHLCIIQRNYSACKMLLKTGQIDIHTLAKGRFFSPVDIKRGNVKMRKRKYQGYAYYGEYALSFAASTNQQDIYDLLIEYGADPLKQDSKGNTVLHLAVVFNQIGMFYHALRHPVKKADPLIENYAGLTPLDLCAKLGNKIMFRKILDFSATECWSFHNISCYAYPLAFFDTIDRKGQTDWQSALMLVVSGKKEKHFDMLEDRIVDELLQKKWQGICKLKFYQQFLLYLFHVVCFTCAIWLRPWTDHELRYGTSPKDYARYVFEALSLLNCFDMYFSIFRDIYRYGFQGFLAYERLGSQLAYYLACTLTVACVPFRFTQLVNAEIILLMIAAPLYWLASMFFLKVFLYTGLYTTMFIRLVRDFMRWAIIMVVILAMWALSSYQQYRDQPLADEQPHVNKTRPSSYDYFGEALFTTYKLGYADIGYDTVRAGTFRALSVFLFIIFMVFGYLVMFNMLIAQMSRTFEKVVNLSKKLWKSQWASMVLNMERRLSTKGKLNLQKSYLMDLDAVRVSADGDVLESQFRHAEGDDAPDNRALMVILKSKTTESQRRKQVTKSWKTAMKLVDSGGENGGNHDHHLEESAATVSAIKFENLASMMKINREFDHDEENFSDDDGDEVDDRKPWFTDLMTLPGMMARARSARLRFRPSSASSDSTV